MATVAELVQEVLAHGFDPTAYGPRVKTWVNEAMGRVGRHVKLQELQAIGTVTVPAAGNTVALPADVNDVINVRSGNNELVGVSIRELDDLDAGVTSGAPEAYALSGNSLVVWPAPRSSTDVTVRYWRTPPALVADADVPAMPTEYQDVLVSYALQRAYRAEDDIEMAAFYQAEFDRGLQQLKNDAQHRDLSSRRQVQGMWAGSPRPRFRRP